ASRRRSRSAARSRRRRRRRARALGLWPRAPPRLKRRPWTKQERVRSRRNEREPCPLVPTNTRAVQIRRQGARVGELPAGTSSSSLAGGSSGKRASRTPLGRWGRSASEALSRSLLAAGTSRRVMGREAFRSFMPVLVFATLGGPARNRNPRHHEH